ncbi:50S ribosomal protein L24 [Candidatus Omnitrophota bacterium]
MLKVKKGDIVQVIKGKERGKKGKVLELSSVKGKAIIEGLNLVKKHQRRTQQEQQQTGIVSIEAPIRIANLMVFCKHCNRPTRTGFTVLKDATKARVCRKCKEVI